MDRAKNPASDDDLMRALNFSIEDLTANRKGRLSRSQRSDIQFEGYCAMIALVLMTAFGLAGGGLLLISGVRGQMINGLALMLIATVVPSATAWWMSRRYRTILARSEIRTMRGTIHKQAVMPYKTTGAHQFAISLGGESFSVNASTFNAFIEDREYTLYIAPHLKQIISAELAYRPVHHMPKNTAGR